jgi:hypothetical protein
MSARPSRPAAGLVAASLATALILSIAPAPAAAQQKSIGALPKYGKWALAAGAVAMNLLAADAHHQANVAFRALEQRCLGNPSTCLVDASGVYTDPASESLFQQSLRSDRRARVWLIGGESALLGAAALFIFELSRPKGLPPNKPFAPEVKWEQGRTKAGFRVAF